MAGSFSALIGKPANSARGERKFGMINDSLCSRCHNGLGMIRGITLGIEEDQIEELGSLYRYDGSETFVKNYMQWDDARFMLAFGDAKLKGKYCHEIVTGLRTRKLLKQVFESPVGQLPEPCQEVVRDIAKPKNREQRRKLEQALATVIRTAGFPLKCVCGDAANFVIANAYTQKSVRAQSRNDEGPILVRKGTEVTTFEEASTLFQSIDEKMVRPHFALYAPVEHGNPAERRAMQTKLREPN